MSLLDDRFGCYALLERTLPTCSNYSEDVMLPSFVSIRRLIVASLVTGACLVKPGTPAFAEPNGDGTVTAPAAAGYWVYVDPETGARSARPPADAAAAMAADPAFSTSGQGLVPRPAPGGGEIIDLQGRFQSPTVLTVGPNGKVSVDCPHPGVSGGKE